MGVFKEDVGVSSEDLGVFSGDGSTPSAARSCFSSNGRVKTKPMVTQHTRHTTGPNATTHLATYIL